MNPLDVLSDPNVPQERKQAILQQLSAGGGDSSLHNTATNAASLVVDLLAGVAGAKLLGHTSAGKKVSGWTGYTAEPKEGWAMRDPSKWAFWKKGQVPDNPNHFWNLSPEHANTLAGNTLGLLAGLGGGYAANRFLNPYNGEKEQQV